MTDLSPTAQAIWKAAWNDCPVQCGDIEGTRRKQIAAALEALADQVVPNSPKPSANSGYHLMNWTKSLDQYYQRQQTREEILAIASELK